jgi:hypothetical protein
MGNMYVEGDDHGDDFDDEEKRWRMSTSGNIFVGWV